MSFIFSIIFTLFIIITCLGSLYVLGTYLLFAYDTLLFKDQPQLSMLQESLHPGPTSIAFTIIREMGVTIICLFLYPLKYWKGSFAKRQSHRRPILLVHGYLHNQSAWMWFSYYLQKKGLGPIYLLNLHPSFASIEHFAQQVHSKASEIELETGIKELILIGHSMGGVISAYYTEFLAPPGKVSDVVTIGSPLSGTRINVLGRGRSCEEIAFLSPFTERLKTKMGLNKCVRYYHVASQLDNIIFPYQSSLFGKHIEREMLTQQHGHISLLFSKRVADQVILWLKPFVLNANRCFNNRPYPAGSGKNLAKEGTHLLRS